MESCVIKVMKDGHSKESAIRICKASLFNSEKKSSEGGHTPTSGMKSAAARALKWHEEGHKGGTNIGLGRARSIVAGESLSDSTVKRMHSFFSRHAVDKNAPGFNSGPEFPSPGRVAWDLWGGDGGASWSAKIAEGLKKKSSQKKAFDQMNPDGIPVAQGTSIIKECPSCGNDNPGTSDECLNCKTNIIDVQPIIKNFDNSNQILSFTKEALQPGGADQPPTQGIMQQPGQINMPTAPNPAMMGDQESQDKPAQDPKFLARTEIANESAAKHFSKIENLEELIEPIVNGLAQQYNLPDDYIEDHILVQATFDRFVAANGQLNEQLDLEQYKEVNPSTNQIEPQQPLNTIKKGVNVPLKTILKKIMKEENVGEEQALGEMDQAWRGQLAPQTFPVLVTGQLKFFLPTEAIGGLDQQTESPFLPAQAPQDVMDQSYNRVPELPAH